MKNALPLLLLSAFLFDTTMARLGDDVHHRPLVAPENAITGEYIVVFEDGVNVLAVVTPLAQGLATVGQVYTVINGVLLTNVVNTGLLETLLQTVGLDFIEQVRRGGSSIRLDSLVYLHAKP